MDVTARISDHMHANPITITCDETVAAAMSLMNQNGIRHLPVMQDELLVGILSEREANLVRFLPEGLSLKISDVMTPDVYSVGPSEPLRDVVQRMAVEKMGAVVIQEIDGSVVGIFTAIDALKILTGFLR